MESDFSLRYSDRVRGNGYVLQQEKFWSNGRKKQSVIGPEFPGRTAITIFGYTQNSTSRGSEQPHLSWSCFEQELGPNYFQKSLQIPIILLCCLSMAQETGAHLYGWEQAAQEQSTISLLKSSDHWCWVSCPGSFGKTEVLHSQY